MGLFNRKESKGATGNTGNGSNGRWTLTGITSNSHRIGSMRREWKSPLVMPRSRRPR